MADNPFGGKSKAPKADPNIGRLAQTAEGLATEAAGIGRDQLAWTKAMEQARLGAVRPAIEEQFQVGSETLGRARTQANRYDSVYAPNEGIQALDAMGAGWLSVEEQGRLLEAQSGNSLRSLRDAFDAEIASIGQARARDATNPIPADAKGGAAVAAPAMVAGRSGMQAVPGVGTAAPPVPTIVNNPAQSQQLYDQQEAEARARFARESAGLESQLGYQKDLVAASKAAEDAASGRAVADATQGEARFIDGLGDEAGRMGVDPSRVLASAGARAPSAAAAAVHGGNTARFAFRDQKSQNLANTVQSGRQATQLADSEYGLGLDALNAGVGNVNNTLNSNIAGRNDAAGWYSAGMSGVNSAANLLNAQQQQKMDTYRAETERKAGWMDLLGTGIGLAVASERRVKKNMKSADTDDTLESIKNMDTDTWEYKPGEGDGGAHVGPYADDMQALGLSDGRTVNPMDTAGLALAGVKQLAKKLDSIEAGLESKKKRPARRAA